MTAADVGTRIAAADRRDRRDRQEQQAPVGCRGSRELRESRVYQEGQALPGSKAYQGQQEPEDPKALRAIPAQQVLREQMAQRVPRDLWDHREKEAQQELQVQLDRLGTQVLRE